MALYWLTHKEGSVRAFPFAELRPRVLGTIWAGDDAFWGFN